MLTRAPGGKRLKPPPSPPAPPPDAPSPRAIDSLVRRLVAEARTPGPAPVAPEPVLLDREVDGVRCVLVRSSTGAPAAPARTSPPLAARPTVLSPREQEIVRMVAQGYPNKVIADVLEISMWTVGTHLRRIFAKLGVSSRAAMVARIMEQGLLGR
jgi:DNA-binding NarL/FixJ family response regulator